jgi:muramoyltetrapeptide carboxypeptidase
LRELGLRVTFGEFAAEVTEDGASAGSAQQRASDFMTAVTDSDVDAIFSAGGGTTTYEILPFLDAATIRRFPKAFIGHCENSWLNQYLLQHAGIASYYGTTFMAHFGEAGGVFPETADGFRRLLFDGGGHTYRPVPRRTNEFFNWQDPAIEPTVRSRNVEGGWHWIRGGTGRGRLIGSEIAVVARMIQLFELDLAGVVLCWDVAPTNPHPVRDLVASLAERADLRALAGMIVGPDVRYEPDDWADMVSAAIADVLGDIAFPVVVNADIGHLDPVWLLPYGLEVELDSANGRLRFPWDAS